MDSLDGSVESCVPGLTDRDAQGIKEHVSNLGARWRDLRQKLSCSLEEHRRLISRQQEFDREYSLMSSVLGSVLQGVQRSSSSGMMDSQENLDELEVSSLGSAHLICI